ATPCRDSCWASAAAQDKSAKARQEMLFLNRLLVNIISPLCRICGGAGGLVGPPSVHPKMEHATSFSPLFLQKASQSPEQVYSATPVWRILFCLAEIVRYPRPAWSTFTVTFSMGLMTGLHRSKWPLKWRKFPSPRVSHTSWPHPTRTTSTRLFPN